MDLKPAEGELISLQVTSQVSSKEEALDRSMETEELEQWERGSRMDPPIDQSIQTDSPEILPEMNPLPDLTDFLKRTLPRILRALEPRQSPITYSSGNWEEGYETTETIRVYQAPSREETVEGDAGKEDYFEAGEKVVSYKLSVSCVKWNNLGTILSVGYLLPGTHGGWCSHKGQISLWNSSNRDEKPQVFETEGCITAMEFHPSKPLVLVVGTFNGQLILMDLDKSDQFVYVTPVDEYFHREAIRDLLFIDSPSGPQLFSISSDSKALHWDSSLRFPIRGFLITAGEGGLCLTSPLDDYGTILIGTESGAVLKGNIGQVTTDGIVLAKWKPEANLVLNNAKNRHEIKTVTEKYAADMGKREVDVGCVYAAKPEMKRLYGAPFSFMYEKCDGPVLTVTANPFNRHLFATGSTDGTVRLYHLLLSKSLCVLSPSDRHPISSLLWSPTRPLVLFIGSSDGSIYIYDLGQSTGTPIDLIPTDTHDMVISLTANKGNKNLLAVGYAAGEVRVIRLNSRLTTLQPEDMRNLSTFISLT